MTEFNRHDTAIHEAAHAVAYYRLDRPLLFATIVPDFDSAGAVHGEGTAKFDPTTREEWQSREDSEHEIVALLAGLAANLEAGCDPEEANIRAGADTLTAQDELRCWGLDWTLDDALQVAREFVRKEWPVIEAVAAELLEHETLDETEVECVIQIADGDPEAAAGLAAYRQLKAGSGGQDRKT